MASGDTSRGDEGVIRERPKEVVGQYRNIFPPFPQRRDGQVNDVQAIEQVFTECRLADHLSQVPVRCGDDANVRAAGDTIGADLLQLAGFEKPQEKPLHAQRHLADLVQEHRSVIGKLELAKLVAIRAGEAAARRGRRVPIRAASQAIRRS